MALKAFRFKYDPILEACLAGDHRLVATQPFETGRHVLKIQQALLDLGYLLPVHGADSEYGPETAAAVSAFKTDQLISPNDGVVGKKTMETLDAIFADEAPFPHTVPTIGEMTLDDFIEALQGAQSTYPSDLEEEFLTRLRQLYYPGTDPDGLTFREIAFDRLLPDAPFKMPDGSRRMLTLMDTEPIFFARLSARAAENPTPGRPFDNPSPYFFDETGTRIDLGHLVLTMDALLHPRAETPYSDFGIPAIDPASWVADLGVAVVWAETDGLHPDVPIRLPRLPDGSVDFLGYYQMSAPEPDLFGDVDGFNIVSGWLAGESLSTTLVSYYVDGETAPGRYRQRFRTFLATLFGSSDPDEEDLFDAMELWAARVNRFADLYALGPTNAFLSLTPLEPKVWTFTPDALSRFFQWLIDQAAIERSRFD